MIYGNKSSPDLNRILGPRLRGDDGALLFWEAIADPGSPPARGRLKTFLRNYGTDDLNRILGPRLRGDD